ncbi:MAG: hypothetical protein QME96_16730, partial [Myxococcota bacterium]|nr:hypothetical protein [Myxococcota bacterium]
ARETILDDSDDSPARVLDAIRWMQPGLVAIEAADAARDVPLVDLVRTRMGAVLLGIEAERYDPVALAGGSGGRSSVPPPPAVGGPETRLGRLVDVVVEVAVLMDGSSRVRRISERASEEGDPWALNPIFEFVPSSATETGDLVGEFKATRAIPRFVEKRRARGKRVDVSIFQT